ncbi:MAG: hypothetical protein F6K00_29875 [Leptolyngbya sp. SIOISBB]|nr:hypothetical protein [Leptolyngbya sp. SIOISBB]
MNPDISQMIGRLVLDVARMGDELASLKDRLSDLRSSSLIPDQYWLSTKEAAKSQTLKAQGISNPEELRDLVRWGVLPIDNEHVRDVALSPGKAIYEFNVMLCAQQVAWWKSLEAWERKQIIERAKAA